MSEQSDTPRTDAAKQFVSYFGWQVHADFAQILERELATATRERDEAIREIGEQARLLGMSGSREAALLAKVDAITRERDEARALNAEWGKKAETWMASPEAAQRLQGYRELAQQVATAQNERDEARAEVAKLRAELRRALFYSDVHLNNGWCPCRDAPEERDEECPACQRIDELAATEAP